MGSLEEAIKFFGRKIYYRIRPLIRKTGIDIIRIRNPFKLDIYHSLYTQKELRKRPFFNIGSGNFWHPYWTNIDYISDGYKCARKNVIHHDLMSKNPLPIKKNLAKAIYTSHTIEHVKETAVQKLFNEAYTALGEGGIFRITCPDAKAGYRALLAKDKDWFSWRRGFEKKGTYEALYTAPATSISLAEQWLEDYASALSRIVKTPSAIKLNEGEIWDAIQKYRFPKALDYFCSLVHFNPAYLGNHVSWWTHDKVFTYLKKAGFTNIYRSGWNQSVSPLMRGNIFCDSVRSISMHIRGNILFDCTHPKISLYVEAIK